ncbi:helix-turn-helix transcriptional regulator [Streptomyces sp. NPDC005953]|uniref:helix-turn-helix domain-containing protein n=1 Tax=Streptomyces sp. NPDC005953 TaxID=3156719 RepID=UPI0033FA2F7D
MTDAPRAQRFARLVAPAARRAGYTGFGSNARLARDIGMSESSASRMIKGQGIPDLKFFPAIAERLDISLIDLLAEMGIPPETLRALSETGPSQVRSRPITSGEVADHLGLTDPIGREMLAATIERLQRMEKREDGSDPGDSAAQM